jgi:hypothetical protein
VIVEVNVGYELSTAAGMTNTLTLGLLKHASGAQLGLDEMVLNLNGVVNGAVDQQGRAHVTFLLSQITPGPLQVDLAGCVFGASGANFGYIQVHTGTGSRSIPATCSGERRPVIKVISGLEAGSPGAEKTASSPRMRRRPLGPSPSGATPQRLRNGLNSRRQWVVSHRLLRFELREPHGRCHSFRSVFWRFLSLAVRTPASKLALSGPSKAASRSHSSAATASW